MVCRIGCFWILMAAVAAACEPFKTVVVPVGPNNPRNSEAAIIPLKDGSLLLGWTEFYAGSGADHGPARISGRSRGGGRTWGEKYTLVENDGGCNVMEVNFLRLKTAASRCSTARRTARAGLPRDDAHLPRRGPDLGGPHATQPRRQVHGPDQRPLHPTASRVASCWRPGKTATATATSRTTTARRGARRSASSPPTAAGNRPASNSRTAAS